MTSIIESMTGVKISSTFFTDEVSLELFPSDPKKNNRVALVYGKNGSGKSTLARGFNELKEQLEPRMVKLEPIVEETRMVQELSELEKIFVFDEDYIASRIKIKDTALDAIVLLGDQVSIARQMEDTEKSIQTLTDDVSRLEEDISRFLSDKEVSSPDYWLSTIKEELRKIGGWAETSSKIRKKKTSTSVTDQVVEEIGRILPSKSRSDLKKDLDEKLIQFTNTDPATQTVLNPVGSISIRNNIFSDSIVLLKAVIQRPVLSVREKELLTRFGISGIENTKRALSEDNGLICEMCFQPITDSYRESTLAEIESILNEEVKKFKDEIETLLIAEHQIEIFQEYSVLPSYNQRRAFPRSLLRKTVR